MDPDVVTDPGRAFQNLGPMDANEDLRPWLVLQKTGWVYSDIEDLSDIVWAFLELGQ